jgi:hypothetical protein
VSGDVIGRLPPAVGLHARSRLLKASRRTAARSCPSSTCPAWSPRTGASLPSWVDQFRSGSTAAAWAVATRWKRDLAAYTRFLTGWNVRYHGDTCPPKPRTRNPITVGGQPGTLLAYNCGILINVAATVHGGIGYMFVFRDPGVAAATDPTDRATFLKILRSVQFSD